MHVSYIYSSYDDVLLYDVIINILEIAWSALFLFLFHVFFSVFPLFALLNPPASRPGWLNLFFVQLFNSSLVSIHTFEIVWMLIYAMGHSLRFDIRINMVFISTFLNTLDISSSSSSNNSSKRKKHPHTPHTNSHFRSFSRNYLLRFLFASLFSIHTFRVELKLVIPTWKSVAKIPVQLK